MGQAEEEELAPAGLVVRSMRAVQRLQDSLILL